MNEPKKVINESVLKMGDIILTTTNEPISGLIRRRIRSDISHAVLYVEDRSIIDSTIEGVHAHNTQRLHISASTPVYALRLRSGLSAYQAQDIVEFVRVRIGTQYSRFEALRAGFSGSGKFTKKQFCSRLVAQAYASVGIAIVKNPNFCSPADIKNSRALEYIPNPTRPISNEEVEFWEKRRDLPKMMREATVVVLKKARQRNCRIQNLSDIAKHLTKVPADDKFINNAYHSSGYLDLWKLEVEQNPSHYDVNLLMNIAREMPSEIDNIRYYCASVLSSELNNNAGVRFYKTREEYAQLERIYKLKTFTSLRELYDRLVENYEKRLSVAQEWIASSTPPYGQKNRFT